MLFGREHELEALDHLLHETQAGRSGAWCLHGEAGIGKTALLSYARARARGSMLVLEATGFESEAELPFACLAELLAPIVDRLDAIPPPQAAALRSALALGPPSPGDRFAAYAATLSLLLEAASERPVLVAIDDAQWLDDSTREAVLFASRRLHVDPIAVVVAVRDGEPHASEIRTAMHAHPLRALDPDAARSLLLRDGAPPLAEGVADLVVDGAAGNPLALIEVPLLLSEAQRAGASPIDLPIPAGQSIARAFARRVELMSRAGRSALIVAAASDDGRLDGVAPALADLGLSQADLDAADSAGLAVIADGVVQFVHPLARSALYHGASAEERRAAHGALAVALERDPFRPTQRAWHLARAAIGVDEVAAVALEVVGQEAMARTSYAAAAGALTRAAAISVDPTARSRRTLAAAAAATVSGQPELAIALLSPVIDAADGPAAAAEAVQMLGMALTLQGRIQEAAEIIERAAESLVEIEPERSAAMFVVVGSIRAMGADSRAVLRFGRRAAELATARGADAPFSTDALLGYALCVSGEVAAAEPYLARASTVFARLGTMSPAESASFQIIFPMLVFPVVWLGRYADAHSRIDGLVVGCRTTGALSMLPILLGLRADLLTREGRLADAYVAARESLASATELRQLTMTAWALVTLARIEAIIGRDDDCLSHAARGEAIATSSGAHSLTVYSAAALGLLALGHGDGRLAVSHLRRASALAEPNELGHPGVVPYLADSVEAHARAGLEPEIHTRLAILEGMVECSGHPGSRGTLARCHGLLAADDAFVEVLEGAVALSRAAGEPFEAARSELVLGSRLRRARRRGEARTPLEASRSAFEQMGARPWQRQAEDELRASGVGIPRSARSEMPDLTVQELQVALRVARGATNREAAAELFVSAKTIEFHLGRVYRKLGIRSRAELAGLVGNGAIAPGASWDGVES